MKSFRSLFFTMPAKGIFCLLLFALSLLFSECSVRYFTLYSTDRISFVNASVQLDSFDYEESYYFKSTVEATLEDVMKLCFSYEDIFDGTKSSEELLEHFTRIGDSSFSEIYKNLSKMDGFHFALVNRNKHIIYSDIPQINGAHSSTNIKKYFAGQGKNQLIVHSCQNPYFATDSFIRFAEFIRNTASAYEDDFDIYITFGSEESLAEAEKNCEKLHYDMRGNIEKQNNIVLLCIAGLLIVTMIMVTVTGKQEPGGKTYPTHINKLPNDLITLLYSIVLICQISLYITTTSMLFSHGNELGTFWFTHSSAFYTTRLRFCVVVFICTAVNLICILKRQYKMGLLIKNTYIYSAVSRLKNMKRSNKTDENN